MAHPSKRRLLEYTHCTVKGVPKMKNALLATLARSGVYRRLGRWSLIALLLMAGLISGVQRYALASHSSASAAAAGCATASRAKPLRPLATFSAIALPAGPATGVPVYAAFPAGFTLKHVHGGPTYVYVISGDLEITDAKGTVTYCTGSFFSEPPGHVHTLHVVQPSEVFYLQFLPPGADGTIVVK
jgi:quercetin dioxygenase-like cupin family protein